MFIVTIRYENKRANKYILTQFIIELQHEPQNSRSSSQDPYLHELAITVYDHDNSQTELTYKVVTILKKINNYNI